MAFQISSLSGGEEMSFLREMLSAPGNELDVLDFDELMALEPIRARTRLWKSADGRIAAFAFVDDFNNLCFSLDPQESEDELEDQVVVWGVACMRRCNQDSGQNETLDASCDSANSGRSRLLERHGFTRTGLRTLRYARRLDLPIPPVELPAGFSIRPALGEQEVERLVELHRAAFETDHMTVEYRLAMMCTDSYNPALDLVAVAPGGVLAAFCVCGIEPERGEGGEIHSGFTEPIGVHPLYQRAGLGKAILTAGLRALLGRGLKRAVLGTSSENIPMQRLAEAVGFQVEAEKVWYAKEVD